VIVDLPNLAAMESFGARIAAQLRPYDVVSLEGDLGAGKTTLARAILKALGHEGDVPSPTFTIIERYDAPTLRLPVVHADFYRLDEPSELRELGLEDYRDEAAMIAEWPDKVGGFSHEPACIAVKLETVGQGRRAIVEAGPDWLERMP
jgi:tRNA threonylcarbamoyladenosine biosynthesis protein TsaE